MRKRIAASVPIYCHKWLNERVLVQLWPVNRYISGESADGSCLRAGEQLEEAKQFETGSWLTVKVCVTEREGCNLFPVNE